MIAAADRRRRARSALASAARALWPGLVAAVVLAAAWRLTGSGLFAAGAAAAVILAAGAGALRGLRRADLLAAAAELDRRSGLEALLATGFEVTSGRVRGRFAPVAFAEAELAAASLSVKRIPIAPARARFLVIPAAALAAVVLLPGGAPRGEGGLLYIVAAEGGADGEVAGPGREPGARDPGGKRLLVVRRRLERRALDEYRKRLERSREESGAPPPPPSSPRRRRRDAGRRRRDGQLSGGGQGENGEDTRGAGADGAAGSEEDAAAVGAAGGGPLDTAETARLRERFPEYDELVRRYFGTATEDFTTETRRTRRTAD